MLRIGIPNRSSFLHTAAAYQCLEAGLLSKQTYHPAKLYYQFKDHVVVLMPNTRLCEAYKANQLDAIFVGGDYALEYLPGFQATYDIPIFSVNFALITNQDGFKNRQVYTKFINTAHRMLYPTFGDNLEIIFASGASETSIFINPGSGAFDIIHTAATVQRNDLKCEIVFESVGPGWHIQNNMSKHPAFSAMHNEELIKKLESCYNQLVVERDASIINHIQSLC